MAELILRAPAKLNLILRVGPRRPDGYHPLRSLMVALDAPQDTVRARRAPARSVECAEAPGERNLAWAALSALERAVGRALPLAVEIAKEIPAQAGLGGGSSDAAAVLQAANRLYGCDLDHDALEEVATGVGSDVPFFVRGGTQWARGRGELLEPAPAPALHVVVVDSGLRLATGEVYARFDLLPPPKRPAEGPYNDLWPAARACEPRLAEVADDIAAAGADEVLLCGSGGAMAGLFAARSAAEVAAEALSPRHRCWVARPAPASPGAGPG